MSKDRPTGFDDELLSAYLDGELTDAERATVEAELERNPEARRLLEQLRDVSRELHDLPRQSLPAPWRESLAELARAPSISIGRTRRGWIWASLAVAAALMIMAFTAPPRLPEAGPLAQKPASPVPTSPQSFESAGGRRAAQPEGVSMIDTVKRADTAEERAEVQKRIEPSSAPVPTAAAAMGDMANSGASSAGRIDERSALPIPIECRLEMSSPDSTGILVNVLRRYGYQSSAQRAQSESLGPLADVNDERTIKTPVVVEVKTSRDAAVAALEELYDDREHFSSMTVSLAEQSQNSFRDAEPADRVWTRFNRRANGSVATAPPLRRARNSLVEVDRDVREKAPVEILESEALAPADAVGSTSGGDAATDKPVFIRFILQPPP